MSIALITKYTAMLDEVYALESLTQDLDSDMSLTKAGANANEIAIPKMTLQGLANYSRTTGFVARTNTLEYETVKFNFDRGGKFSIDSMDDEETQGVAFGMLAGEFERTKVIPEVDAFRFAMYAGLAGLYPSDATLSAGDTVLAAINVANGAMDEAEVPVEGRILYITPTLLNLVKNLDTTKSREALDAFKKIIRVPQTRFYTAIDQYDGTTGGEEVGGYVKDAAGKDLNFMIIHPSAVLQFTKHKVSLASGEGSNLDADAKVYRERLYALVDAYDNKVKGIYRHNKAS